MFRMYVGKYLHAFQSLLPPYLLNQSSTLEWMAAEYSPNDSGEVLIKRYACKPPAIETRGTWLKELPTRSSTEDRNQMFQIVAEEALLQMYNQASPPQHIMHVTCTGYISPSATQKLVATKKWATEVTHMYHMGCYAAMPAIRLATSGTDIVHTELCSLHFRSDKATAEQIVLQSLFADGMIKYSVTYEKPAAGLEVIAHLETIIPNSQDLMSWKTSSYGFDMSLGRRVPNVLKDFLEPALAEFLKPYNIDSCIVTVHPGGPKIIDMIQEHLSLLPGQVAHSREVLKKRGNMSSATLPHIWESIISDNNIARGTHILSLAFGPGLTLAMALFRKC